MNATRSKYNLFTCNLNINITSITTIKPHNKIRSTYANENQLYDTKQFRFTILKQIIFAPPIKSDLRY